jgi:hypothetical protein
MDADSLLGLEEHRAAGGSVHYEDGMELDDSPFALDDRMRAYGDETQPQQTGECPQKRNADQSLLTICVEQTPMSDRVPHSVQ